MIEYESEAAMTKNRPNMFMVFNSSLELLGLKLGMKRTRMLCKALLLFPKTCDVRGVEQRMFKT
jgi:hypothetical protein